jgi:D-alanyl-D-alanine carboxypeptidase/D-alanyl-D-alanine-endopeptidase (penicillin-binding protein 4)
MGQARQRRRRGLAAAVVAVATFGLPAVPSGAAPATSSGVTSTPLLSVRRVPGWVAQTVAAGRLKGAVAAVLGSPALRPAVHTSCLVVTQGGRVLYAFNPGQPLIPASNVKLLTAMAVLDRVGAARRLTTTIRAARPAGGVVNGNLYLVGGGDPLLRTPGYVATLDPEQPLYTSLVQLAARVKASGVEVVRGAVVGDESRYDQVRAVPTWSPAYAAEGDVGPLSALEVNDGSAPGATRPGTNPGNPVVWAAATFTALLRAEGVRVVGAPGAGKAPAGTPLLTSMASPSLAAEVEAMLTVSDDTAAELFTKELGYQSTGSGTTVAGLAAIRGDLAAHRLPVSQAVLYDGSGLDRSDRLTCALVAAALQRAGPSGVVARGLPVAARTGTLRDRMAGTAAAGRLRAKTGTLKGVSALSGFVLPRPGASVPGSVLGQPIIFSLIVNGLSSDKSGRAIGDQIGAALAAYPHLPPLAEIEPRR